MKCPCYDEVTKTDCPRRKGGCAKDCPDWAEYLVKRDEEYKRRKYENEANSVIYDRYSRLAKRKFRKRRT